MTHHSHKIRSSDSSMYDEICTICGGTDAFSDDSLDHPCAGSNKNRLLKMQVRKVEKLTKELQSEVTLMEAMAASMADDYN